MVDFAITLHYESKTLYLLNVNNSDNTVIPKLIYIISADRMQLSKSKLISDVQSISLQVSKIILPLIS